MNNLVLSTQHDTNATLISNIFIDKYMPSANGEFVKIYIYLLRAVANSFLNVSISSMADNFNQTEADVIRALKYWHKNGVLQLSFDDKQQPCGITLCNLLADGNICATTYEDTALTTKQYEQEESANSPEELSNSELNTTELNNNQLNNNDLPNNDNEEISTPSTLPDNVIEIKTYTPAQILTLSNKDVDFKMLIHGISNYLGAALSPSDISCIAFFYDTLKFPSDLIEYLIEYCARNGHKSMRYIEKVALAWANDGIKTVQQAKYETSSKNSTIYTIMNAFGLASRLPGQEEREYIEKWTTKYGFTTDVIVEACNRTLRATQKPSFQYANKILSEWRAKNIFTQEDIKAADERHKLARSNPNPKKNNVIKNTSNRFNNFTQRDIDINSLERLLLNNNSKNIMK